MVEERKSIDQSQSDDSKYDKPIFVFQKPYLALWIPLIVMAIPITLQLQFQFEHEDIPDLMYVLAEIHAMILTVTLGITLLGLQFRAQSYTMVGMIEYINDKVVYGFITIFVVMTISSIILAVSNDIKDDDLETVFKIMLVGTFASLLYHAGYVYHIIYKLQLSQMFDDTIKKIEKNIGNIEEFIGKDDEFIKPFQIWQGIMIKASETHNLPEFKNGLEAIFKVIEEKHEESRNKQDQYIKDRRVKIVACIEDVRQTSMTEKQYLFLNEFICKFESIYKDFIYKYGDTEYGSRGEIIKKFEEMICRTIDDNEYGYSEDYLNRLFKMYWDEKLSDNERYDLRNEMIFTVNNIVNYAIANKSKTTSIFINLINNKENNIPTVDNAMSNNDNFRRDTVKFNDPDQAALWPDFPKNPHRDNTKSWIIRVRWYITITRCLQRITLESISSGKLYELNIIFRVMEDLIEKYYESTYQIISTNPDLDENLHYALIKEFNKYIKSKLANSIYDHDYRILDIIISYVVGISKYLHIDISNTINILERSDNVDLNILAKTKYKVKCLEIYSEIIKYSLKKAQNLGDVEAEKLISDLINSIQCVEILPKTYDWSRVDHPTGNSD